MLNENFLTELEDYLQSGKMEDDFEYSEEERRLEMLDYLERLMDLAEVADEVASRLIFKNTQLEQMLGDSKNR